MSAAKYPGCQLWHDEKTGNWQIAWPIGNPSWDGGIEWLATFREKEDAETFVAAHSGEVEA